MKQIFAVSAIALAGLAATAAQAGDKPVIISIHEEVPVIYYTYNVGVPVEGTAADSAESTSTGGVNATRTSGRIAGRSGNGLRNQDVIYARLLEEAQKRGLR